MDLRSPQAWKTYGLRQVPAARARRAACAEVDCPAHLHGWRTVIAAGDAARLVYLRGDRTRRHVETRTPDGQVVFTYEAGQTCFAEHWVETQQLFLVHGGGGHFDGVDPRGNPKRVRRQKTGLIRRHTRGELWVEDAGEHQQAIADARRRG